MKKLYTKVPRQKSMAKFLELFLCNSYTALTCYANATYYNKKCTKLHCKKNKWRGFDDLFILMKTYYKTITPKKLMLLLISIKYKKELTNYKPYFGYCNQAGILRIMPYIYDNFEFYNKIPINSQYNWKELFILVDIKTEKQFKKFRKNL